MIASAPREQAGSPEEMWDIEGLNQAIERDFAVRIDAKRLRYTLEFTLPWYVFFLAPVVRRIVQTEAVGDLAAIKAYLER